MNEFREWWEKSNEAHKARHDGEEACAREAWNAAIKAAMECVPSCYHGCIEPLIV